MNSEIGASVERALAELRQEISQRLRASNEEIQRRLEEFTPSLPASYLSHGDLAPAAELELGPGARRGAVRALRDAIAGIDRARSQADILAALLRESAHYASRAAVLLVRGGELRGWGSEGFGDAGEALRNLTLDAQNGTWGRLAQAQGAIQLSASDCAALCSRIESPLPSEGVLVPILLRDRVAAGLYADRLDDAELGVEALQILAHTAAQAIETLPFRERSSTPTLALDGGGDGAGIATAPAEEPPAAPVAAAAAPAPVEEPPAAEPAPQETPTPAEPVPAYAPEPEPSAWAAQEEAPEAPPRTTGETVAWDASTARVTEAMPLPGFPRTSESPLSTLRAPEPPAPMEEEVPRFPRSVEPEPEPARSPGPSPDATVLLQRSSLVPEPPPAPSPLRPVPPPEEPETDRGAGTPEVRPPSGVEGPGWAFATTRVPVSADNQALHEEARRLARLLVSEIKLYNEEQVEEGRRNRDIYERLREDIDRSRQMYDERVDPQILRSTDYFYQELVRILAAGDSKALGI
ncbi:MAG TPA: hypothetical protein VFR03_14580 [Thermoanaerobaculia bacterium]|nr:hypothetical protein [Thermoanaerobaculia bacterium]